MLMISAMLYASLHSGVACQFPVADVFESCKSTAFEYETSFPIAGTLWIMPDPSLDFPHTSIYALESSKGWKVVKTPADLRGRVSITNKAAALAFVELRTSPSAWRLYASRCQELTTIERMKDGMSSEERTLYARDPRSEEYQGGVSNRWLKQNHLQVPTVVETKRGFVIRRNILCWDMHGYRVERTKELVSADGNYLLLGAASIRVTPPHGGWGPIPIQD